ncbi:uncharacterized protein LOC141835841 isoform X2 [Curcuma longa]|uniref:uncharacterized protein LOC141835841 isoform X2 n=1 Tax=Curcuma longa TaxID=136217 RepID=UPI003D9E9B11
MTLSSCRCHYPMVCCLKSSVRSGLPKPNPPKSQWGDAQHASTNPPPVSITLEKKPSCEKVVIEQKSAAEGKCEILLKSSLKKPRVSDSEQNVRGNVKWLDFFGKELVEIKEFEPTESEEEDHTNGNAGCICAIQ